MKKLFYLFVFTVSLSVKSQITFDYSLPTKTVQKFTTTSLGEKLFSPTYPNLDTVRVFNSDGSVYRVVKLPSGYYYVNLDLNGSVILPSVSDKLFNSDTLLEFIGVKSNGVTGKTVSVINELGQIQYTFPDTNTDVGDYLDIVYIDGSFKVWYNILNSVITKVFSVPGSLPCNQCNFVSGLVEPNIGGSISELRVNPNPFNSSLEINYDFLTHQDNPRLILTDILGRELKSIPLSNQSDRINLNTSDLPKGTIIVSLIGSGQNVISKKVIKVD